MNLASPSFDLPEVEEAPVEESPCAEVIDETVLPALRTPEEFGQTLRDYRAYAATLHPVDALSLKRCAAFVATCKHGVKFSEAIRKSLVDPLNKKVKEHNEIWMPNSQGFDEVAREVDGRISRFVYAQQQKDLLDQQRELARAAQERALIKTQEDQARAAAATALTPALAAKEEAKADRLELKAEMVIAEVVPMQSKTLDLGGVTLSAKAPKKNWALHGWDKSTKVYGDDARLRGVDPAWLLRFCTLDVVRLNAAHKSGDTFPLPFVEISEFQGSVLRGAR